MKPHQTVTWGECSDWLWCSKDFDVLQIRLFCVFTSPCSEKWASSIHIAFSNHCGLRSVCAKFHVAKFCLTLVSADNNWWSDSISYRYRSTILCRIRRIDSSTILVIPSPPLMSRLRNLPWHFLPHGHCSLSRLVCNFVDDLQNFPVSSERRTTSSIHSMKCFFFFFLFCDFVWNVRNVTVVDLPFF